MKKMKSKLLAFIMVLVLLIGFALGFSNVISLDKSTDKENLGKGEGDELIGCLITTEYLDLFDVEKYITENLDNLDKFSSPKNTQQYENRIYAVKEDFSLTDEESGEKTEYSQYVFKDVEGYSFYDCYIKAQGDGEGYTTLVSDDAIWDCKVSHETAEGYKSTILEGTLYVHSADNDMLYLNPVYQAKDGEVYLLSGMGSNVINGSQSMKEEVTVTVDGEKITKKTEVIVNVQKTDNVESVELIELDKNCDIVKRKIFTIGNMPNEYTPDILTDSIIVQQSINNENEEPFVKRIILNKGEEMIELPSKQDELVCLMKIVDVKWH